MTFCNSITTTTIIDYNLITGKVGETEESQKGFTNQDIANVKKMAFGDLVGELFVTDNIGANSEEESTKLNSLKESKIGTIPENIEGEMLFTQHDVEEIEMKHATRI